MGFGILKKENADDVLSIFIAILMFQSLPRFPIVGQYFQQYPFIIFGLAMLLLLYRKKVIEFISK